jgi:hypothetical protein
MFRPMKVACARGGKMAARMVRAPFPMPEEPAPAMARPTISIDDDWAAPHNADPNRKTKKNVRKVHWKHPSSAVGLVAFLIIANKCIANKCIANK